MTLKRAGQVVAAFGMVLLFAACSMRMAAHYDQAVVDGLTAISEETMTQLAANAGGTRAATYAKRQKSYNELIGRIDALILQMRARPMPKNRFLERVNENLAVRGIQVLKDDQTPSAGALKQVLRTVEKMQEVDKKQGLTATEVTAFKHQVMIYLDQALTYENFLER
jgi:hypothetical protein